MNQSTAEKTITTEIEIRATPERVFRAWTDPKQLATWWGEEGYYQVTDGEFDLRVGGKWRSNGIDSDGTSFHVEGEYLVIDPPKALTFTWNKSWEPEPTTTVSLELLPTATGTLLKLRHWGFTTEKSFTSHNGGWPRVLGWMRDYAESVVEAGTK